MRFALVLGVFSSACAQMPSPTDQGGVSLNMRMDMNMWCAPAGTPEEMRAQFLEKVDEKMTEVRSKMLNGKVLVTTATAAIPMQMDCPQSMSFEAGMKLDTEEPEQILPPGFMNCKRTTDIGTTPTTDDLIATVHARTESFDFQAASSDPTQKACLMTQRLLGTQSVTLLMGTEILSVAPTPSKSEVLQALGGPSSDDQADIGKFRDMAAREQRLLRSIPPQAGASEESFDLSAHDPEELLVAGPIRRLAEVALDRGDALFA